MMTCITVLYTVPSKSLEKKIVLRCYQEDRFRFQRPRIKQRVIQSDTLRGDPGSKIPDQVE